MLKRLLFCFFILASLFAVKPIVAADKPELIEYDIFRHDSRISIWLNLAQFLSSKRVEHLKEGIDFALEYHLILSRPKRFWGAEQAAKATGSIKIGYRIVTEDYFLSTPKLSFEDGRRFVSLAKLHQFLADSIVVDIAHYDELDRHVRYTLEVKLTCILLTSFNLTSDDDSSDESDSPLKYLFRKFLQLTGFGREEYSVKSRSFLLSEVSSRD